MFTTNIEYKVSPRFFFKKKSAEHSGTAGFYLADGKKWAWNNYISLPALQEADKAHAQLQRMMERFEIELVTLADEGKLFVKIRQVLVCGFFMQIAHKEDEKGNYLIVKDHQVTFFFNYAL